MYGCDECRGYGRHHCLHALIHSNYRHIWHGRKMVEFNGSASVVRSTLTFGGCAFDRLGNDILNSNKSHEWQFARKKNDESTNESYST